MAAESLTPAIAALLASAGLANAGLQCRPLPAGGNNRVYRVQTADGVFAVKHYFHGGQGERDRLASEFAFLRHAWAQGIRCVPQPLAADAASHLALYEFIDGRKLGQGDIDAARVLAAAGFFADLNAASSREKAPQVVASDACFGVAQHVASIDRRLKKLQGLDPHTDIERAAQALVTEMLARWADARPRVEQAARGEKPQRCLSPSDFGFHNVLARGSDGSLCFLDFEYAGWDDPAKMAGDFFWHAEMRPDRSFFSGFVNKAFAPWGEADTLVERVRLLNPAFRLRWCCIALNDFVAGPAERRRFAARSEDIESRKSAQLAKARALLNEPDLK